MQEYVIVDLVSVYDNAHYKDIGVFSFSFRKFVRVLNR